MKTRPLSFGGWIRITETPAGAYTVMSLQSSAGADDYFLLSVNGVEKLEGILQDGGGPKIDLEESTAVDTINVWYHVMLIVSTFDHRAYVNGVSTSNQGQTPTPVAVDEISAGTFDGSTSNTFHGDLSRWGFWSSELSQADISLLAVSKLAPPLVSAGTLEHYFKWGTKDDADTKDSLTWATVTGTPTTTADVPDINDSLGLMMMLA